MNLDQLEVLEAVVTHGSFKAASEKIYRSQPALSIAVKKLEEEFGFLIFSREKYRPALTIKGKAFYEMARKVLDKSRSLETFGKQLSLGQEPEIKIAFDVLCPLDPIFKVIKECDRLFPDTKLNFASEQVGGVLERIEDGEADLGLTPVYEDSCKIESLFLVDIKIIPVAAPFYPPAMTGEEISLEELKEYVQIIIRDSSRHGSERNLGVLEGGRNWSVNDPYTKKKILLAGLGWGGMPEHLIQKELQNKSLIQVNTKIATGYGKIFLVRRKDKPIGPVSEKLWELFIENLPEIVHCKPI